jgi:hypothetical protein
MSSVENWTKRDEWELFVLANDHSTSVIVRRANDHPFVRSCTLGVHLTRQVRWTTSKQIQVS